MSRPLRHVPREKCLFEVTVRTVQARLLLRPSVALNEIMADWKDKVWARRYRAIAVSDEPEVQRERMRYILAHASSL
jgi:hypothetical protein